MSSINVLLSFLLLSASLVLSTGQPCFFNPVILPPTTSQGAPTCNAQALPETLDMIRSQVRQIIQGQAQVCQPPPTPVLPSLIFTTTVTQFVPAPTPGTPHTPLQDTCVCPQATSEIPTATATSTATVMPSQMLPAATSNEAQPRSTSSTLAKTELPLTSTTRVQSIVPTQTVSTTLPATSTVGTTSQVTVTPTSTPKAFPASTPTALPTSTPTALPASTPTIFPTSTPSTFPASCTELAEQTPGIPSGYYWIDPGSAPPVQVYCNMDLSLCGNSTVGWMRVAYLNTSETEDQTVCPGDCTLCDGRVGFSLYSCGRGTGTTPQEICLEGGRTGCCSGSFPVFGIPYTRVSGRVNGYWFSTSTGLDGFNSRGADIDLPYVDGVSITTSHTDGDRMHIWSFTTSYYNETEGPMVPREIEPIVGEEYFCEGRVLGIQNIEDPLVLWDGELCQREDTCCNEAPWFCNLIGQTLTRDIEVRICGDSERGNTPVFLLELYVQ